MKIQYKFYFLIAVMLSALVTFAQTAGNTDYNIWHPNPDDTFYVYGKTANVREAPGLNAAIQDSLVCGNRIIILSTEHQFDNVKGIYAPWVKVAYSVGSERREGYIWLGLLSLGSYENGHGRFVYGIEKITSAALEDDLYQPAIWHLRVKALTETGALIDEKEWKMDGPEIAATGGKLLGDMGLQNIIDILRVNFGGEACGVPTNYFYFGWTGKEFLHLPGKMEVGDAGVYYYTEKILFPKEQGGKPSQIIKLSEESEALDKTDKNGEPIFKTTKSKTVYNWNGTSAVKIKGN